MLSSLYAGGNGLRKLCDALSGRSFRVALPMAMQKASTLSFGSHRQFIRQTGVFVGRAGCIFVGTVQVFNVLNYGGDISF
jgi:hypothetical protein